MRTRTELYFVLSCACCLLVVFDAAAGIKNIRQADACNLLNSIGLFTLGWQTYYDNESGCSSRQMPIGSGNPFKNVISYYVEGVDQTVNKIRLIVNILNSEESKLARAEFLKASIFLIRKLTPKPVPENFARAIENGTNQTFLADGFIFEIIHKSWKMNSDLGARECYEVKLVIR